MSSSEPLVAGVRVGDYILERDLADGSFEAIHVVLPRTVRLTVAPRPVASVRMMREACILEALRHPGVPRVYEVGMLEGSNEPWIATELVVGESLLERTLKHGRLGPREVLGVIREVAEILAYAHRRGVAHRGVLQDSIVRPSAADVAARGYPLVLVGWGDACGQDAGRRWQDADDDNERKFSDDVFALGLVADLILASRAAAPAKLVALVDDMLAPDPLDRPAAAEVALRAKLVLENLDPIVPGDDDIIVEENIVLVDISRSGPPPLPPIPPARSRRWTPAIGLDPTPSSQGVVVGVIKPRSDS